MSENGELENRVKHLEERVKMLVNIADPEKHPFTYLALETNLTHSQVEAILELMDKAQKSLRIGDPMNHAVFEGRVYEIVPIKNGDYHFAESIVATLNDSHQYSDVYEHMKKDGMNI